MSTRSGYTSAQVVNHGTVAANFSRTEMVFVKAAGVLEVQFVGDGGVINYGTVAAGTQLDIAINQTTTNTTADIIVHR